MTIEIAHPHVSRLLMDTVQTIDVGLGKFAAVNFTPPIMFLYKGKLYFYFSQNSKTNFWLLCVDTSTNEFCWYSNVTSFNGIASIDYTTSLFLSNGFVVVSQSPNFPIEYKFQIPDLFIPNSFNVIPVQPLIYPGCPCGGPGVPSKNWFSYSQQLIIREYAQSFPLAYNLWASVFNFGIFGTSIKTQGYLGNFTNGVDPIISNSQLNAIYSPITPGYEWEKFFFDTNDFYMAHAIQYTGMPSIYSGFYKMAVNQGLMNCDGNGTPPSLNIQPWAILDQKDVAFFNTFYGYRNTGGRQRQAITDRPNVAAFSSYSAIDLFNGSEFVELWQSLYGGTSFMAGALIGDKVYSFGSSWNGTGIPHPATLIIESSTVPIPIVNPVPIVEPLQTNQILNWHRPISTQGKFRT